MTLRQLVALAALGIVAYGVATHDRSTAVAAVAAPEPRADHAACPVAGAPITSPWGSRSGGFHDGVDLAAPIGTPIRAVLGGTVTHSGDDDPGGYGSYVELAHSDGTRTQYGHVSVRLVRTGQHVTAGQVIARVGNAGESTGPHLHLRVRPHPGRGVDPVRWLRARGITLPCG